MREWHDEPDERDTAETVDKYHCHRCHVPVGWSLDLGEGSNVRGNFAAYLVSADKYRRWCEDCASTMEDA